MRVHMLLLLAILFAFSTAAAWGYPTLSGASGLVSLPTAEVSPTGTLDLALDYQQVSPADLWFLRANAGLAENLELSGGYTRVSDDDTISIWNLGLKYQIAKESEKRVSLAVGGSLGKLDNTESIDLASAFLVLSKSLSTGGTSARPFAVKGHAGLLWLSAKDSVVDEALLEPFLGVEFIGEKGASLGLEYRLKDSDLDADPVFSAVLRYPLAKMPSPLWLQVGTTNAGFAGLGGPDQDLFIGLAYRLTTGQAASEEAGGRTQPWGY